MKGYFIKMKEILGGQLDQAFVELNINAKKTYQTKQGNTDFEQVWELSDEDYEKICNLTEDDWKYDWGWWRGSTGSNMGGVDHRYNINNHYIKAWDGIKRERYDDIPRKYRNLLEYFCEEIGASTEKNVTAVAVDLARQNNMTIGELFNKYQE